MRVLCVIAVSMVLCMSSLTRLHAQNVKKISINEAVRMAVENNEELQVHRAALQAKKSVKGYMWLPDDPVFEIENEEIPSGAAPDQANVKKKGVSQKLEFPYKWYLRNKNADAGLQSETARFEQKKSEIIYEVGKVFYQLEKLNMQKEYLQSNLKILTELERKAEVKRDVGEATGVEVFKAKVETQKTKTLLENMQNEITVKTARLNFLINSGAEQVAVASGLTYEKYDRADSGTLEKTIGRHPLLKEAEMELLASSIERSMEKWNLLPDLNIGYLKQSIDNEDFWVFRLDAEIPLWMLLKNRAKIAEKTQMRRAREAEVQNARNLIKLQVRSALLNLKSAEKLVLLLKDGVVKEAEDVYGKALKGYQEGEYSYLEFWDSQKTLIESKMEYADVLLDYYIARLDLQRAMNTFEF